MQQFAAMGKTTPVFGVITALPKEYAAVKAMLNNPTEERAGQRSRRYLLGEIPAAGGGSHVVAVVLLPAMGNNSAAARAALLVEHFLGVRQILMVGIAGAAPCPSNVEKHVRLGDIVVSGPHGVVQYDYVAEKIDDAAHRFPPRPPSAEMIEAVRLLEADELAGQRPWLAHIARAAHLRHTARPDVITDRLAATPPNTGWLEHPSDPWRVPGQPRVFIGKIGSANILLKNPQKRDRIQSLFDVRAFEMEGSGIADASWDLDLGYLVIRGNCDYCDAHKGDAWQGYAAVLAAAYMRALIESIPGYPVVTSSASPPSSPSSTLAQTNGSSVPSGGAGTRSRSFQDQVVEVYRLMHYNVEQGRDFGGRQVHLFLDGRFGDLRVHRVVECLPSAVTVDDVEQLLAKLRHVRHKYPAVTGTVVSATAFPAEVRRIAAAEGIHLLTLEELSAGLLDGDRYTSRLIDELVNDTKYRLHHYIEPLIGVDETGQPHRAREILDEWLADPDWKQLTLLGDVGTGKTFLSKVLAKRLADAYAASPVTSPLPILIDLRNADRLLTLEGLVSTHLQQRGLEKVTYATFQHALTAGRIVLILDGFDEMAARITPQITIRNFHELVKCVKGNAKLLITCRTHYFKSRTDEEEVVFGSAGEYETEAARELYWDLVTRRGFKIAYLRPFEAWQIEEYVKVVRPDDAKQAIERMRQVYNLMELSQRPMLLDLIVKSIDRLKGGSVNAATLYLVFTNIWVKRDGWRDVLPAERKLSLLTSLALHLWTSGASSIHHRDMLSHLETGGERARDPAELLAVDNEMRTASFLVRDHEGHYSFAHKSYAEFFVARYLAAELDQGRVECLDVAQRVSPEIVGIFLVDLLKRRDAVEALLASVLTGPYHSRLSENALLCLYGLRRAQILDAGSVDDMVIEMPERMHLEGAQLADVVLGRLVARGAFLAGAVLCRASLVDAVFTEADLTGADLTGAQLPRSSFRRTVLTDTSLAQADLTDAMLDEAECTRTNFSEAVLVRATIKNARIDSASFAGAELEGNRDDLLSKLVGGDPKATPADALLRTAMQVFERLQDKNADSEELAQRAIIRLFESMRHGRLPEDVFRDEGRLVALCYQIFRELRRHDLRWRTLYAQDLDWEELQDQLISNDDPEQEVLKQEVHQAITELDERPQRILRAWLADRTFTEIAVEEGVTEQSVRRILNRAIDRLRQVLTETSD